ncbi:hypothetical protein [Streptomyces chiangmaiensis]|uniref:hypothetical protein n=1 Tax=Streptomyces chiangmaiensis TaxID=766497 RepID=UPI0031E97611
MNRTSKGCTPCSRTYCSKSVKPRAYVLRVLSERWRAIQPAATVHSGSSSP